MKSLITEAENRWLELLSRHCRNLFAGVFLPSHDHFHHDRVWSYARSLLLLLESKGIEIPGKLAEQLLISVYFHDVGLSITRGEKHGAESRKLCENFFRQFPDRPDDAGMDQILYAIEHHDDKSLKAATPGLHPGMQPDLLSLLTTSDDLDAFGRVGIYRYAEIYLLRGTAPGQLPARVSANVRDRFMNIRRSFGMLENFIRLHESRYLQVYEFYLRLGEAYSRLGEKSSWEPVLIDIFKESLQNEVNLLAADRLLPQTEFSAEIRDWFSLLDLEIQHLPVP